MKQLFWVLAGLFLAYLVLVSFNYWRWAVSKPQSYNRPEISLQTLPTKVRPNQLFTIDWHIETNPQQQVKTTAIYYATTASPSALLDTDSPAAVGYTLVTPDYLNGNFLVPSDFAARIQAPSQGKLFLRAYTYINGHHLWTDEKSIDVEL